MSTIQILNFTGLILNFVGTFILAISLSKYLTSIHGAIAIHDMTIKGLVRRDPGVYVAQDMGNLLIKGLKNSTKRTTFGVILVALGFLMQLVPFLADIIGWPQLK